MKLIRTLIDAKRSEADAQPDPKPDPRPRSSQVYDPTRPNTERPVSMVSRSRRALSEPINPRLKEFKSDLEELTPRRTPVSTGPKRKKVWDLDAEELATPQEDVRTLPIEEQEAPTPTSQRPTRERVTQERPTQERTISRSNPLDVSSPLQPRRAPSGGRVKTRIMGFSQNTAGDLFGQPDEEIPAELEFPIGWLVVTHGPGRGKFFALQNLVSTIGRGEDQTVTLNFGDDTISRNNHAAVAYDDQTNTCFLGYGGKANLVRLNGRPVLSTEQLNNGDVIRVGETDLRFVALCGPDFTWAEDGDEDKVKRDG